MREIKSIDKDWKFHLGDIKPAKAIWGYIKSGTHNQTGAALFLDDSEWKTVSLPHDFVMDGYVTESKEQWGEDNTVHGMEYLGNLHITRGSLAGDVAWYRRRLEVDGRGKRVYLRFDGIYRDSEVYVNEFLVGKHQSGYTGVLYDITDFLYEEKENIVAVRVDARTAEGWFYEGGGIYRHAYVITTPLVAVAPHGIFVKSDVDLQKNEAELIIETKVLNRSKNSCKEAVSHIITAPDGVEYSLNQELVQVESYGSALIIQNLKIKEPMLWDVEQPRLYTLRTFLAGGDEVSTEFGIRHMRFDPDHGFFLNGNHVKIKGVCCHQDHAGLGAALPDGMQYYCIQKLKEMGCNAYRCAHNPATDELLSACDRLGMLVMDENRLLSSSEEDLGQLTEMVLSARNHPSVFLWSMGNEEVNIQFTDQGRKIAETMRDCVKSLDHTRPVTVAVCMWEAGKLGQTVEDTAKQGMLAPGVDVFGFNYFSEIWDAFHKAYPEKPLICTEDCSFSATRGCRMTEDEKCHMSVMDKRKWSYLAGEKEWKAAADRDYIAGTFIWTGFDYHGEPSHYSWPAVASQFGIMDLCGFPKDAYYYYKAWWGNEDVLRLCTDGEEIWCLTNCEEVELFAEGISCGRRKVQKNSVLIWREIEKQHKLLAVGYRDGTEIMRYALTGYGSPKRLVAIVDYLYAEKDNTKTAVVNVHVLDEQDNVVEDADNMVTFSYPEHAVLLGTGNGDPASHEHAKRNYRRAFNGSVQAIFSITGNARIKVSSLQLEGIIVEI